MPRVQVVEGDYEDLPGLARDGKVDIVMGGYVPDPSVPALEWSQGYLDFGLCLIVAEGMEWQFKQPSDLAGKTIAIYDDPAAERWVEENIKDAVIRKFSGERGWFEALESGQASALVYVVKAGDTLSLIAQREMGSRERWQDIWKMNTNRVANPDLIYPRLVLLMP